MYLFKNEAKAIVIILVLLMAFVTLLAMPIQPVKAQLAANQPYYGELKSGDTPNFTTNTRAFLSFIPTTIGVGQMLLVNFWINPAGPSNNVYVPDGGFVITITKPDGTTDIRTMRSEPATFANYFTYYPDQVGTWQLKFEFLGAYFPAGQYYDGHIVTNLSLGNAYTSVYFKPSQTGVQNLTVQSDMVYSWPLTLPPNYWTRPASINNRGWWPDLGSYPGTGYNGFGYANWDTLFPNTSKQDGGINSGTDGSYDFTPWVQGPNTAHIVWKRQGAVAGLIGGPAGQYGTTSSPGSPSVIYAGRCYQTMTVNWQGLPTSCAVCYDLRTGVQYYAIPTAAPYNGITPTLVAYNNPQASGAGTIASEELGSTAWSVDLLTISGSSLLKVNAYTGAVSNYSIAPLSGGVFHNQIGGFVLNIQDLGAAAGAQRYRLINWTTRGTSTTLASRIVSNTTYARSTIPQYMDFVNDLAADCAGSTLTGSQRPFGTIRWTMYCNFYRLSTGASLYNLSTTDYPDLMYNEHGGVIMDHGKVAAWSAGGYWIIFDGFTGTWYRSETTDYPWSTAGFGAYDCSSAYGILIRYAYNYVYGFNWTDGSIVWKYEIPAGAPFESPYTDANGTEVYSFNQGGIIADGKVYVANTEHTPTWPLTRGWSLNCINITNGDLVWKINNPILPGSTGGAIADGYLAAANAWDGYMYVFGKGLTATTVTAPNVVTPQGTGVVIQGTVLDQSPAQPGTPCVSKDSMETQMEYLHLQMPIGGLWGNETITGVPVTLQAIDSNNNVIAIGTVTSNGYYGTFSTTWTPPNVGQYQIIASFAGDDSYGSSGAATTISVGTAATATPTATPTASASNLATTTDLMTYILVAAIAIVIAIAIVGALILMRHN